MQDLNLVQFHLKATVYLQHDSWRLNKNYMEVTDILWPKHSYHCNFAFKFL